MSLDARNQRSAFKHFRDITTRWMDNDVYGHVNNVTYYSYFDTVVNGYLVDQGLLDFTGEDAIGLVVETRCQYFSPLTFPQNVVAGLRVAHLGRSSVRYEIGIFGGDQQEAAAQGYFVHVYVDREHRRPIAIPEPTRTQLQKLLVP